MRRSTVDRVADALMEYYEKIRFPFTNRDVVISRPRKRLISALCTDYSGFIGRSMLMRTEGKVRLYSVPNFVCRLEGDFE